MKTLLARILLAVIFVALLAMLLSCSEQTPDEKLNRMKSPVIVIGIHGDFMGYSVAVKDSTGTVTTFYGRPLANAIGESRHVGDTIK